MTKLNDERWMTRAFELVRDAEAAGEVPVGAVVLAADGALLAEGANCPIATADPTAHAEVVALRAAGKKVQNYRLMGATLYVTLEPCAMCVGALMHARVARVVFGANDPKSGAVSSVIALPVQPLFNHKIIWRGGVLAEECSRLLSTFFQNRRKAGK